MSTKRSLARTGVALVAIGTVGAGSAAASAESTVTVTRTVTSTVHDGATSAPAAAAAAAGVGGAAGAGDASAAAATTTPKLTSTVEVPTSSRLSSSAVATSMSLPVDASQCPAVELVAVNGVEEAKANTSTTTDTGYMAQIAKGASTEAGAQTMSRVYVPYPSTAGPAAANAQTGGGYAENIATGVDNGKKLIAETVKRCPGTKIFLSGFEQGAQVASEISKEIGTGNGPVSPDQFAGGVMIADPTRPVGASTFPGDPSRTTPGSAPGTAGANVAKVSTDTGRAAPAGGGLIAAQGADYGAVKDRVASLCAPGDLACDTEPGSDVAKVVANVTKAGAQSDPLAALTDTATVTGQGVLFTAADTINQDVNFDEQNGFTIAPATQDTSTLHRMATYSDPRFSAPQGQDTLVSAGMKLAGMALGASVTVAKDMLTPATIAEIAAAGALSPAAAAAVLTGKLALSAIKLVTPATIQSGLARVASEVEASMGGTAGAAAGQGLTKLATDTQVWQSMRSSGMYSTQPYTTGGQAATGLAKQWATAAAKDAVSAQGSTATGTSATTEPSTRMDQLRSGGAADAPAVMPVSNKTADTAALKAAMGGTR